MTRSPAPEGIGPLHVRLRQGLARDIESGRLAPGDRLPTHRDLAFRLGIGIGTVTRAYAEAEGLGLITSHVGRGSFVAHRNAAQPEQPGLIDMSRNLAPTGPSEAQIKAALVAIGRRGDLVDHLAYAPPAGFETHRRAGAAWIKATSGFEPAPERLIVTVGAQQALSLVFGTLCRPGDVVLTEAATYFGLRTLAEALGLTIQGVAMDGEGLVPEALDEAAAKSGARVVCTLPTCQNPTGRLASPARRAGIARVARARDLWIVEDDIYAPYAEQPMAPIAAHAPERSFHISGVSKAFAPGLRTGYLLAPDSAWFDRLLARVRAFVYAPPSLGSLVATHWIESGLAQTMLVDVRTEAATRWTLAQEMLGARIDPDAKPGPHVWLPIPGPAAERLAAGAQRHGIAVTPPAAPLVAPELISGVRLCLGPATDRTILERALRQIADQMANAAESPVQNLAGIV